MNMMAKHFKLLLLLALCSSLSVSGDVFVSIDCGASGFYTDANSITWMGDDDLIQNGISKVVQSSNSISPVLDTLRVFTTRKKNCYSIKVDKDGQVLVRASFFYGNYDGRSSPPSFVLTFDGNFWATVQTSSTDNIYYETTYVVKGDVTSVCVAQNNPSQFPFISSLEVRSLDAQMYGHINSSYALFLYERLAYGASTSTRFPDDPYDRIWVPASVGNGLVNVTNDAPIISSNLKDNPPQAAVKNAITTPNTSFVITLGTNLLATPVPAYINWYFSEVKELNSTEFRSFRIFKNGEPFSLAIVPPYENVTEFYVSNYTASSNDNFSVEATTDSSLPPIINAIEVFGISDMLTDGTNSNDVEGLISLQNTFDVLQEWSGDPCLPSPYTWDWLNCSNDATPRVTALHLASFGLSGSLPDISSMDALQVIDLHNNSLTGSIPDSLGTLPNLQQLNLADNQFSGPVPTSLSKNNGLKLTVTGNPSLCTSGTSCTPTSSSGAGSSKKKSSKLPAILGTIIPVFFIFWAIVGLLVILRKRRTAAVASAGAGQVSGGNGPNENAQGSGISPGMLGKIGKALVEDSAEAQVNVEMSQQAQGNQYGNA